MKKDISFYNFKASIWQTFRLLAVFLIMEKLLSLVPLSSKTQND